MLKHAKLTTPYTANPHLFGAAVQSNKVYQPPLSARAFAGIAARRINAIIYILLVAGFFQFENERTLVEPIEPKSQS